jgi:hypothetical protein
MGLPQDILNDWLVKTACAFDSSLIGKVIDGKRKISGQLLTPPDTITTKSTSSSSKATSGPSLQVPEISHSTMEIPASMYSEQALQFIGFDAEMSRKLLERWVEDPHEQRSFEEMIFGYLDEACATEPRPQDWIKRMNFIGISKERQAGIMDPNFEDTRGTGSMRHWIIEFARENFLALSSLNKRLTRNLQMLMKGPPQLRGGGGGQDRSDYYLRQVGHTTLYRATSAARLEKVFDSDSLRLEGMILMGRMPPSDFSLDRAAYYWTPQPWVAEKYAMYTQRNCGIPGDIAILRVLCPSFLLENDKVWKLDFSSDWKKLIFHSRRCERYPKDIEERWEGSRLIIGPVSITGTNEFVKMKSWTDVTEENFYKKGKEIGHQYAWIGVGAMADMNKEWSDKLDVFKCYTPADKSSPTIKFIPNPKQWVDNRLILHGA